MNIISCSESETKGQLMQLSFLVVWYASVISLARLLMPSLTKKRAQLPGAEVTMSRKLSSVHIHVERSFQRLKAFRLFHMILPVSFIKRAGDVGFATIDELAIVCCGLVNLQTPIINTVHEDPAEQD